MSEPEGRGETELEDQRDSLIVLVQLENGAIVRLHEQKQGHFSIEVSQGFAHKKRFKSLSSYANLAFYPDSGMLESSAGPIPLAARLLVSFKGVVECLISGPPSKRRALRDLLGDDTSASGKTIVWGDASVSPLDCSSLIAMTPKKGILTLEEALYPIEKIRKKELKDQVDRLFRNPSARLKEDESS